MNHPVMALARDMDTGWNDLPKTGDILLAGRRVPVSECVYHPIPAAQAPRTISCVDGGSAILARSPAFAASINRLYCATYRGGERRDEQAARPAQFLSLMRRSGARFRFTLYPYGDRTGILPDAAALDGEAGTIPAAGPDGDGGHRLLSLPRSMGEWKMAGEAAGLLDRGDCIVMDGSLHVWGRAARGLARSVMGAARRRGVAVCGLSKTTGLRLDGGRPLMDILREGRDDMGAPWYADIGRPPANPRDGDIHTMAVMLHASSRWVYRLDMDAVMWRDIGDGGVGGVLASLAANSSDSILPGYPYGLYSADRFARVRNDEASAFAIQLRARMGTGPRRAAGLNEQHEYLNRVAG